MAVGPIDNIGIAVRDIGRAIAFYRDVLGFEVTQNETDGTVQTGNLSLYIFETSQKESSPPVSRTGDPYVNPVGLDHIAFAVGDVDAVSAELEARGLAFETEIIEWPGVFRYRPFADPDGNRLFLLQRLGGGSAE